MTVRLSGIIPPCVTPFDAADRVDEQALRLHLREVLADGVHGLTVCGSTGEGATLTLEETTHIARIAAEEAQGCVPVVVGIIQESTGAVVRYGHALRECGADGLQITPIHYLFAPDPDGTCDYYATIGREVGLPIVIYNVVPWNTLSPDLLFRLADVPQVRAVKQSGGDIHKLADLLAANEGRLTVLSAVDDLLFPSFLMGAHGAVAAILTILPDLGVRLWDACQRGDIAEARALHERILPVWRAVEGPDMPGRVKAALELRGRAAGRPRGPMQPASAAVREKIAAALRRAGVV